MTMRNNFAIESLVDFPDDAIYAPEPITAAHIDAMMRRLVECGVRRVSWAVYGDGQGGFLIPGHSSQYLNMARTYQELGRNPLKVAAQAAHQHGLEIYGYFKPYETGPSLLFPEGSYEAVVYGRLSQLGGRMTWLDPFVADHPHLRIRRRRDDLPPGIQHTPICSLKLRKKNDAPTRITPEHLQIWASDLNYRYHRLDIPFEVTETIKPCPRDVPDLFGEKLLARKGDPQRVLTLHGLDIRDRHVLITTDFSEGPSDFENTDLEMLSAFDASGREITGVFASGSTIWCPTLVDFRNWGLMFDHGCGGQLMCLDEPNGGGRNGVVAFTRSRNEYLPGALCETEPKVQAFWMKCIATMLDSGVDGIDFREESHSTHTDYPEEYGFNEIILEKCRQRGQTDLRTIAEVRGDAYTDFLTRAKAEINRRGKAMRINFQIDWYRPDPARHRRLAYPANLDFQWQRWIDNGLTDEAVLRFFALPFDCVFNDPVAQEVIERCHHKGIPVTFNRYVAHMQPGTAAADFRRVRRDGRFAGFILYETGEGFLKIKPDGRCDIGLPYISALKNQKS